MTTTPADTLGVAAIGLAAYRKLIVRRVVVIFILLLLTALAFISDLGTGPSSLSFADVLRGLMWPETQTRFASVIIWDIRLPQALTALIVGAALSLAGAEMQTVLDNPLASPFTLGISGAATFGASLAIVLNIGFPGVPPNWVIPANAFVFALVSTILLQLLARAGGAGRESFVLVGIAMFFTFNALVSITQFIANEQALQQLVFWTMGSLSRATYDKIAIIAAVFCVVAPLSQWNSWQLTALRLGADRARSLGINLTRLRYIALVRISLLTGVAVAFVGTIAFVGLVGPHIARLLVGEDHRFFLPASMLSGALVMSLSSLAAKAIIPGVMLPIGLVTSLIGVPFFLALLLRRRT